MRGMRRCHTALCLGYVLRGDRAGAGLFLGGDNADLEASGDAVDLQGMQARPALAICGRNLCAQPVNERTARTILREMKTYGGRSYRLARLVRNLDRKRARAAGGRRIYRALAFNHLYL